MALIIDNTYFVNELYIPHAKPSITTGVTTIDANLDSFIDEYVRECLIKCLGLTLAEQFIDNLDENQANWIASGADAKWDYLLNGHEYTYGSDTRKWRGIRFKNLPTDANHNRSFLANYVYIKYEANYAEWRAGVGDVKAKAENASVVSAAPKIAKAHRKMTRMIQGRLNDPKVYMRYSGVGVDYFDYNEEISLYTFIEEMNDLVSDTYPNFKKSFWNVEYNQFGI